MIDRRQRRSMQPRVAARFYLDSLAMNHGLSALILATPEGKLVCGSESRRYGKSLLVSGELSVDDRPEGIVSVRLRNKIIPAAHTKQRLIN